jgi:two-component system LytT family response regulator
MLRLMVVDDEPPARRGLKRLVQVHEGVEVIGEAGTLADAHERARALRPDGIFLDVELASEQGFQLIDLLDPVPAIVFVTAHSAYAPKAFDVAALDFLLKPVDPQRLALSIERLRRHKLNRAPRPSSTADRADARSDGTADKRIQIRTSGHSVMASVDSIAMLAAEADFTRIVMTDARDHLICRLLGHFAAELPTPPFLRVSRSLVVNLDHVAAIRSYDGGRSVVSLGPRIAPIALGRAATRRLRRHLSQLPRTAPPA